MKKAFDWLVRHEKSVFVVAAGLVVVLGLQTYFKGNNRTLETRSPQANISPASAPLIENANNPHSVTGKWEMLVQKRKGTTSWILILEQNGEALSGMIKSEGGDLPLTGTIKGRGIQFAAKRFGVKVEFLASINDDAMTGQMHVLTIDRKWTAKRLPEIAPKVPG
jgi:hypothetical protein